MSAQIQAVGALCMLLAVVLAVLLWMFWPTSTRIAEAQLEAQRRRQQQLDELAKRDAALAAAHADDVPAPANWHSGEHQLVERPAGDTQEWETQERIAVPEPVEVVEEPPMASEGEVAPPAPEVPSWMTQTALEDEPTPLAPGPVPVLERLESHTDCWKRDGLLERIRQHEYETAKAWRDKERAA